MPFKRNKTNVLKTPTKSSPQEMIRLKQINERYKKTRFRLLLWIGGCIALLVGLIIYASIRVGGVQNLIKGNSDIVTNTVNNVGTAVVNPTATTATTTVTPFTINVVKKPKDELTVEKLQNTLVISKFGSPYSIKVKKGSYVMFINDTGKLVGLQFSDKRQFRFEKSEQKNVAFLDSGTITFTDVIDSELNAIEGTVTVVE